MKLQAASRKELSRMAVGCSICFLIEAIGFVALYLAGIVNLHYSIFLGALGGTIVAIVNFGLMCLMVQNAAGIQDQKLLRAKVQASYNLRILFQAAWVLAAFLLPCFQIIAAAIPLLFPTAVIWYLQMTGKLNSGKPSVRHNTQNSTEPENTEDQLKSFEV